MVSVNDAKTTIQVYAADRDWLQARQLASSSARAAAGVRGAWLPMPDVVRELIAAVRRTEEGETA